MLVGLLTNLHALSVRVNLNIGFFLPFPLKLIDQSPVAIQMGENFYYQMIDRPFRQRFVLNSEVMTRLCTTEDALEGINAFIEKQQPVWKGK